MTDSTTGSFAAYFNQEYKRERSMTDSTTGSFAAYFSQGIEQEQLPQPPVEVEQPRSRISSVSHDDLEAPVEQQVQDTQWQGTDASDTSDTLRQLLEGIRIITRQMKYAHNDFQGEEAQSEQEYQSWSDSCSILSCTSDDERRLSDISRQLEGNLGTGLMGLSHAAQMLGESSRMASDEASLLMQDVRVAQDTCEEAQNRANKAESVVKILYKKQKSLIVELEQAKLERNVLKRQVKALLKEKFVLKKNTEAVRVLELHVMSALTAHEMVLHQSKLNAEGKDDVSPNVATVRLECSPREESASGNVESEVNDQHLEAAKETTESKVRSTSPDCETFVEVTEETTKKNSANEADTSTSTKEEAPAVSAELQQKRGKVGGLGGVIGLGGSWLYKQKSQPKLTPATTKTVDMTHEAEQAYEPVMITPTHSVDELEGHGLALLSKESIITDEWSRGTIPSPTNISVASDNAKSSLARGNHSRSVSPSPTETYTGTRMKSFFRGNKPKVAVKKPLLHLDDESVDPTESSQECNSESPPSSDSTSVESALTCGAPPPKSLTCDTTAPVSPFLHDFANTPATDILLDDRVIRSLAIPSIDNTSRKVVMPIPVLSKDETFVEVTEESTKKKNANEADTSTSTKEEAPAVSAETQQKRGKVGGLGSAIGFGGSWLYKQKSQPNLTTLTTKTVDMTHEAEQAHEPVMITPTHSVDELEGHGLAVSSKESIITDEWSRGTTPSPTNTSVASDKTKSSLVTSSHSRSVSPSPTETYAGTRMKSFFRAHKPKGAVKKPLLHLDDESVDAIERLQECISESAPSSDSTSVESALTCGAPPPKSLTCDTTIQPSPFLHDFANESPTDVLLDDKVIRSLAIPSIDNTSMKIVKPIPILSTYCPPEIAQLYAEIGQLHEC